MVAPQSLPWTDPLEAAAALDDPWFILLYSGTRTDYSGRFSYLAYGLEERIEGADFDAFAARLSSDREPFDNAWFGYLGYGLKDCLETLPPDHTGWLQLPPLCMMRFATLCRFDHETKTVTVWSQKPCSTLPRKALAAAAPHVAHIHSNMTQAAYLSKVAQIIECIGRGDLYQANLTRKFIGEFASAPDGLALFAQLCKVSPAPYSAFLHLGDTFILSSSPEMFLTVDGEGCIKTRPIKGTAPRSADPAEDEKLRRALAESAKDRAENLMIVDLMRNDLSRSCVPGSVHTDSLFDITSHATIHHMSSTVSGRINGAGTLEAVKHCFPPGSMTGAPKIQAMKLCSALEQDARGVYSGAIGWFGGDGACELSVVIRTLLVQGTKFEFQAGGAIVADSKPEAELQEHLDKTRGILLALGMKAEALKE